VPDPGGLEELLATGVSQGLTNSHQIAAIGSTQALKRSDRSLQLSPCGIGHLQHLLPSRRQRLAVGGRLAGRPQCRDRRVEFLRILTDVGLRLRRGWPARRGITALGHRLQKRHRSGLAKQVEMLHDRQAGENGRIGICRGGPAHGDADDQ